MLIKVIRGGPVCLIATGADGRLNLFSTSLCILRDDVRVACRVILRVYHLPTRSCRSGCLIRFDTLNPHRVSIVHHHDFTPSHEHTLRNHVRRFAHKAVQFKDGAFAKFDEVQKYLSITNHVITPYIWTVNKGFYDGLSAEHRNIVDWASEVATEAGRGVSRVIEASERGLPKLAKKMEVNVVSPAEQKKFADVAQPAVRALIEEKLGAEGVDMLNAMMAAIAAAQ